MHKSNRCFKLEIEWAVFSYKLPQKRKKVIQKEKSCTKSEKLLEGLKVAPNLKSCSKVAEQLMDNPKGNPLRELTPHLRCVCFYIRNQQEEQLLCVCTLSKTFFIGN